MLRLIDVSGNQGSAISWPAVAQAGVAGAFCKVVEGAGWFDDTAPYNAAEIKAAGLVRGYYAFARPDLGNTPQQEAQYFLDHIPDLAPGDLLALDLEMPTSGPGEFDQFALSWLQFVEREVGVRPLVYTGRWYAAGDASQDRHRQHLPVQARGNRQRYHQGLVPRLRLGPWRRDRD